MPPTPAYDASGRPVARRRGCMGCLALVAVALDGIRRAVFGAIAILILAFCVALLWPTGAVVVEKGVALVLRPQGVIVEELAGDPLERAVAAWLGAPAVETRLRDLVDATLEAADDKDIAALVLDLDDLLGGGPSHLAELGSALAVFRSTGKPIIASAAYYTRPRYYLASHASEIHLDDMGAVLIDGYSTYRTYMREGLERIGADWNVFRVGSYKSAVEPFIRDDMSPEAEVANLEWLGDLWSMYLDDVSAARGVDRAALAAFADDLVTPLLEAAGDPTVAATQAGLVDAVGGREAVVGRLIELVGEDDEHSFRQIDHHAYIRARGYRFAGFGDAVGVVVASGTIVPGEAPPGTVGGDSTARLLRRARFDDAIKAVVLRIDSPGGSAFASEVVRREVALLRAAGKPIVVSMASVAASGGYWIAMGADEIWAHPQTITGSIGIFAYFPTFDRPLAKYLGMHVDGVGTTNLAGRVRPDLPLPEEAREVIRLGIEHGYRQFTGLVAEARGMSLEAVEAVAGGRVWSGVDAAEAGLVDALGGFDDAVAAARIRADLPADAPLRYIERQPTLRETLVTSFFSRAARLPGLRAAVARRLGAGTSIEDALGRLLDGELAALAASRDPRRRVAHCFCRID